MEQNPEIQKFQNRNPEILRLVGQNIKIESIPKIDKIDGNRLGKQIFGNDKKLVIQDGSGPKIQKMI